MPIGIRNGTEIGYDLREVAEMLWLRDKGCSEGGAFIQKIADYFRRENLVELHNVGGGYDVVSGGAVRAYCYDCGLNVPPELAGTRPSPEEMPALMRMMWRDREGVLDAAPEAMSAQPASVPGGERKHGGARPEIVFVEGYVEACRQEGLSLQAMRQKFVPRVRERIEAGDPACPFLKYDPIRSVFTVCGANGEEREFLLASVSRSIGTAEKKIRRRRQR